MWKDFEKLHCYDLVVNPRNDLVVSTDHRLKAISKNKICYIFFFFFFFPHRMFTVIYLTFAENHLLEFRLSNFRGRSKQLHFSRSRFNNCSTACIINKGQSSITIFTFRLLSVDQE